MNKNKIRKKILNEAGWKPDVKKWLEKKCSDFDIKNNYFLFYTDYTSNQAWVERTLKPDLRAILERIYKVENPKIYIGHKNYLEEQIAKEQIIQQIRSELPKPREKDSFSLKVIDLLRVIPDFEEKVAGIRRRYNINPQKLKKELSKIVPNKQLLRTIRAFETPRGFDSMKYKIYRHIGKGWYRNLQKILKTYNQMHSLEETQCPLLSRVIGKLRNVDFGRIPLSWSIPIKNYIFYNKISDYPLLLRRRYNPPEIGIKSDPQTLESYIEMKIYGDTDLDGLTKTTRKFQRLLPTYHMMNQEIYNTTFKRWVYYYLRKKIGLKHEKANKLLEVYGFNSIDPEHASQELKRFEDSFKKSKK